MHTRTAAVSAAPIAAPPSTHPAWRYRPRTTQRARDARFDGAAPGQSQATILAVDDEPEALDVLRALFTVEGYDFTQAADAAQAIALIQDRQPDLLIVDYMMPGMSGIDLCEYLRTDAATADIPIIIYSAYTVPERYWQKGLFERAFAKPADHDELLAAIASLLLQPR